MIIPFSKISNSGSDFSVCYKDILLSGNIKKISPKFAKCNATCSGKIQHHCDICGKPIDVELEQLLELYVSDGFDKEHEEQYLDIYEFEDGNVDFTQILRSEIEANLSDYYYCKECQNK